MKKFWIKIRDLIRSITKNLDDYDEKYMKTKFYSGDNLRLAVFHKNNKYYPQVLF